MPFSVLQTDAPAADAQAEKRHSSVNRCENRGAFLQFQPEVLRQKMADPIIALLQLFPTGSKEDEVIHVAHIAFDSQPLFDGNYSRG